MRKWIGLYILICLLSLAGFAGAIGILSAGEASFGKVHNDEYISQIVHTEENDCVVFSMDGGENYKIEQTDKNLNEYETEATIHMDGIYYLFRYEKDGKDFLALDKIGADENWVIPEVETDGTFLAAGKNDKAIFCSVLGDDGRTITEYVLMATDMTAWQERQSVKCAEDHFVVTGKYVGDKLYFAREDGKVFSWGTILDETDENAEDMFFADGTESIAKGAEKIWRMNSVKETGKEILPYVLVLSLAAVILLYGRKKWSHVIYRVLCVTEIVSLLALAAAGYIITDDFTEKEVIKTGIEAGYALEEIKLNQKADSSVDAESYRKAMENRKELLEDLVILSSDGSSVILSKTIPAGCAVENRFGSEAKDLALQAVNGKEAVMMKLDNELSSSYAVAVRDWTDISPDSVLLAVISESSIENSVKGTVSYIRTVMGSLMAVVTAVHIALFISFHARWKKFAEGISYVAAEKKPYTNVPKKKDGMQSLWAPLDRIGHIVANLHYERELLYRRYYRLIPKGMENLLNKAEMADVEVGDKNKIRGCMVQIVLDDMKNCDPQQYMDTMTKSMELMHDVREKRNGIFLSASTDMHERKLFFEQDSKAAMQFAVELIHQHTANNVLTDNNLVMIVHSADFNYGVSGVKNMMTPYMYSKEESTLEPYAKALAKAKVKIALTEQTLRLIGGGFYTRYIGFVTGKDELESIKIYECLDAYPETKRKVMTQTDAMFQRGLQLFYSNDFYLARNTFNEVLKLNENDHIARWYLFHCEYHLNNPEAEVLHGLFENIVSEQEYGRL